MGSKSVYLKMAAMLAVVGTGDGMDGGGGAQEEKLASVSKMESAAFTPPAGLCCRGCARRGGLEAGVWSVGRVQGLGSASLPAPSEWSNSSV